MVSVKGCRPHFLRNYLNAQNFPSNYKMFDEHEKSFTLEQMGKFPFILVSLVLTFIVGRTCPENNCKEARRSKINLRGEHD